MRLWKKILLGFAALLLILVGLFLLLVGPWPTYSAGDFHNASYYRGALAAVDRDAAGSRIDGSPKQVQAGWAERKITPPIGTPLAGFGDRQGKPSTGVHDDLYVRALALSDGSDTVVIVGSDMLIVPENLADAARAAVTTQTPLKGGSILFNSSHTHSGPGAWGPGLAGKGFAGKYDPKILELLTQAFTDAIVEAYGRLEPAAVAHASVDTPEFIRNRTREAAVDSSVDFMVIEQDDKDRCYVVRYSAHPTVLGGSNMEFSADFPGYLQRAIAQQTGAFAMYLGGALGSMGPKAPEAADGFAKAQAMGEALAQRVLQGSQGLQFNKTPDIASAGASIPIPPVQLRVTSSWRLSPFLLRMAGVDDDAWIGGVRIGDVYLVGAPCDFSGELSRDLKDWARTQGRDLWMLSFNGDYVGYISPDKYYDESEEKVGLFPFGYEMGLMSWCGPNGGSYFTDLSKHVVEVLAKGPEASS